MPASRTDTLSLRLTQTFFKADVKIDKISLKIEMKWNIFQVFCTTLYLLAQIRSCLVTEMDCYNISFTRKNSVI